MTDSQQNDPVIQEYENALAAAVYPDYFLVEQFCNAGTINIDYVIPPVTTTDPAAASLETGAPPLQQVKPSLGGAVFPRQQYNGALRLLSNILAFINKGNLFTFNTSNTAGYSNGAVLFDYATGKWVQSLKDSNTANFITNPNLIDGINWKFISVNPSVANTFQVSPLVPTPAVGDNGLTAINKAYFSNNGAGYTQYNFGAKCQNTPTFLAGEEFLLIPTNTNAGLEYDLYFFSQYVNPSSKCGMVNLKLKVGTNETSANHFTVEILSVQAQTFGFTLTQQALNSLFSFKWYLTGAGLIINGVTIGAGLPVLTLVLNSDIGFAGAQNYSLRGLISSTAGLGVQTIFNNNALLGITNGILTLEDYPALEEYQDGVQAVYTISPTFAISTNVANMSDNNLIKWLNGFAQDSGISSSNVALLSGANFTGKLSNKFNVGNGDSFQTTDQNNIGFYLSPSRTESTTTYNSGTGWINFYNPNTGGNIGLFFDSINQIIKYKNFELANQNQLIGIGQTWQNVTSSRAAGVTYTNTTSKPIAVSIRAATGIITTLGVSIVAMGQLVCAAYGGGSGTTPSNTTLFTVVPPNGTYSVSIDSGSGGSIVQWNELR